MQAQEAKYRGASEETILAFKRHILESSAGFASEPAADAFRVSLLSLMLNRYDLLCAKGLSGYTAARQTIAEFSDIPAQMSEMGFEKAKVHEEERFSRWPKLTEEEAQRYIRERDAYIHKTAMGIFMCVACIVPLMVFCGMSELLWGFADDAANLLGLVGMFAMIGMGVYVMVSAAKPKEEKKIRKGRFSLGAGLRRRIMQMKEGIEEKARKRRGRGVALCVMSLIPVMIGAVLSEMWFTDAWPMFGVAGMFLMIAAGVYELVMADGEKKTIKRILGSENE